MMKEEESFTAVLEESRDQIVLLVCLLQTRCSCCGPHEYNISPPQFMCCVFFLNNSKFQRISHQIQWIHAQGTVDVSKYPLKIPCWGYSEISKYPLNCSHIRHIYLCSGYSEIQYMSHKLLCISFIIKWLVGFPV